MKITIILATNEHPMSVAIRGKDDSEYSHVVILEKSENRVIEASPKRGVCYTPLKLFLKLYPTHEFREMEGDIELARALIGQEYDFEGLAGQALDRPDYQDPTKTFCSEVVSAAARAINTDYGHRLRPDAFKALSWTPETFCSR